MNSRAKHLMVGIITIVAGATVLQWVLAALALANPFPFGGCLSPMWESSRYSCIVDIAIRTNKPVLCKLLLGDQQNYTGWLPRLHWATEVLQSVFNGSH